MISSIGWGASCPPEDSVKISRKNYNFIRHWAELGASCDSMLLNRDSLIANRDSLIANRELKIDEFGKVIVLKTDQLQIMEGAIREKDRRIKRLRNANTFYKVGLAGAGIIAIVETVYILLTE